MRIIVNWLGLIPLTLLLSCHKSIEINHPDYESNGGTNPISYSIDRIKLNNSETVLDMSFYNLPGYWVRINSETKLIGVNTGKVYSMLKMKGMTPDSLEWMPEEGFRNAALYFEPIDPKDTLVDFIESDQWIIKGIKLTENKGRIKTNISGIGDFSFLKLPYVRIIEAGEDFDYAKTFIVPVRDGKFSYDIFTEEPRLFKVIYGDQTEQFNVALFWSEGDSVTLKYPSDNKTDIIVNDGFLTGKQEDYIIEGGLLTDNLQDYFNRRNKLSDSIYKNYLSQEEELKKKGLFYTPEFMELDNKFKKVTRTKEREKFLKEIEKLYHERKAFTPEAQKLMEEQYKWYNENKDSIFNCFFKFDYENFKNPSMIGLALLYSKVRQANNSTEKYIKIFRENYKDFYPEHPYHRYLTEISRIYENN